MPTHLEASLQRDVDRIRGKVTSMAELAERALRDCVKALQERNRQFAYSIILRDQRIDELEKEIDRLCLEFLVRQHPVAGHLRFAYATIKINADLERIGDYAESVAKQILKIDSIESQSFYVRFIEVDNLAIHMFRDAVLAFLDQDAKLAAATMVIENAVDILRAEINGELFRAFQAGKFPLDALVPLMTIARRFERVTDQAKNICEEVLYMCTGEFVKHPGTEVIHVLFVDQHNACRSQMAEAIANTLGQDRLLFASAGLDPRPVDPRTISFLLNRGIDIASQKAKAVSQIPNLDHYHVMIALDKEAQRAFPTPPTKTVCLEWIVADPSVAQGAP